MSKPAFSVLLPTRGRHKACVDSVHSLRDLAECPEDIEILVRHDDDDAPPPIPTEGLGAVKVWGGPRFGYGGMHNYYNQLAAEASGDWLFVWNDDTVMLTPKWDAKLREAPSYSVQFPRRDITQTTDFTFPVMGRAIYNVLGRIASNGYCDAWLSDVTCFASVAVVRDDVVFHHHRFEDDETMMGQHRDGPAEWARFGSADGAAERRAAMSTILAGPEWGGRFDGWDVTVVPCGEGTVGLETQGHVRAYKHVINGRVP